MKTLSLGLSLYSAMESLQNLSHSNFQVNLPQFLSGNGGRVLFLFIFNIDCFPPVDTQWWIWPGAAVETALSFQF